MSKLVVVEFNWFRTAHRLECDAQNVLEALLDTLLQQGEPVRSLKFAYGSTVCVNFADGDQIFVDLLVSGKRGRPSRK